MGIWRTAFQYYVDSPQAAQLEVIQYPASRKQLQYKILRFKSSEAIINSSSKSCQLPLIEAHAIKYRRFNDKSYNRLDDDENSSIFLTKSKIIFIIAAGGIHLQYEEPGGLFILFLLF